MIITLKDGSTKEYSNRNPSLRSQQTSTKALQEWPVQGEVNGEVEDLRTVIDKDCNLSILTFNDEGGKSSIPSHHIPYHGTGNQDCTRRPSLQSDASIADGFYYDVDRKLHSPAKTLKKSEAEMKKNCKRGSETGAFRAAESRSHIFYERKKEPYKVELIEDLPERRSHQLLSPG